MFFVYNFLSTILAILIAPFFLLHPRGRQRFPERLGFWGELPDAFIWLHGASVGEINGLLPLIPKIKALSPNVAIVLTATSPTGLERAENLVDYTRLLPFDSSLCLNLALRSKKVKLFCFGETEIWPSLLNTLSRREVPIVMVNATISDFTAFTYQKLKFILKPCFKDIKFFAVANKVSQQRLIRLGIPKEKILLTGNMKYDHAPSITSDKEAAALKLAYFTNENPVVVLGSIRPGEEFWWFSAIQKFQNRINFVVAPRHAEKFEYFKARLEGNSIQYFLWSEYIENGTKGKPVLLLDAMGQLEKTYSFANLAFIGASLIIGIGGHNPLEAAAYGCCVAMGPYYNNLQQLVDTMIAEDAIMIVRDLKDIETILDDLLSGSTQIVKSGLLAKTFCEKQQGAVVQVTKVLKKCLSFDEQKNKSRV